MLSNKNISKGISLFIKTCVFVFSVSYIVNKIGTVGVTLSMAETWQKSKPPFFIVAVCLVPLNWGVEAVKWKYLIKKIEPISISTALKAVLSGLSISIFTPNRVGEFAGKVFYLKTTEKLKATIASFIGSTLQLLVTVITGLAAIYWFHKTHHNTFFFQELFHLNKLFFFIVFILLVVIIALSIYFKRSKIIEQTLQFKSRELFSVFFLSSLRYFIFSLQYYLILKMFGVDIAILDSFILIALTFFASAVIPTFALTEIAVRSASSVYFFSTVTNDSNAIVSASITLWIINLAIPALIGGAFIWQLNFFNE